MNNMPLDVMRDWCEGGTVIGVNPMPTEDKEKRYNFGPSLSGWEALKGRLRWFGSTTRAPSILGSVMRATEINSANRMRLAVVPRAGRPDRRAAARRLPDPRVRPVRGDHRHRLPQRARGARCVAAGAGPGDLAVHSRHDASRRSSLRRSAGHAIPAAARHRAPSAVVALDDLPRKPRERRAAGLRAELDRARRLEQVHVEERRRDARADGQQPVVAQHQEVAVAEVAHQPRLLVVVERDALVVVVGRASSARRSPAARSGARRPAARTPRRRRACAGAGRTRRPRARRGSRCG